MRAFIVTEHVHGIKVPTEFDATIYAVVTNHKEAETRIDGLVRRYKRLFSDLKIHRSKDRVVLERSEIKFILKIHEEWLNYDKV